LFFQYLQIEHIVSVYYSTGYKKETENKKRNKKGAHQGDLLPSWKPTSIAQNRVSGNQSRKADLGERSN
jgi:hypothetical protein